jgi:hypothetical protein
VKYCPKCKKNKEKSKFFKHKNRKDGLSPYCKECATNSVKTWRINNKESFYRSVRDRNLKQKYGINLNEYQILLESQNGCCAICRKPTSILKSPTLKVDHCHKTGRIRGLLCSNCNMTLGLIYDDVDILKRMIDYLIR